VVSGNRNRNVCPVPQGTQFHILYVFGEWYDLTAERSACVPTAYVLGAVRRIPALGKSRPFQRKIRGISTSTY
jgi:hypothetical protein